jgi:hypothetical protein
MSDRADQLREALHEAYRAGYWDACDYHRISDGVAHPSDIDRWIDNNIDLAALTDQEEE